MRPLARLNLERTRNNEFSIVPVTPMYLGADANVALLKQRFGQVGKLSSSGEQGSSRKQSHRLGLECNASGTAMRVVSR